MTKSTPTDIQIKQLLEDQRSYFRSGATLDVAFRVKQLKALKDVIGRYESQIIKALHADLHKGEFEAFGTEIGFTMLEIDDAIKNVERWARPKTVPTPIFHFKGSSYIKPEPYGMALIIAPWNYPFQLLIAPAVGAIAAGNTLVLKPSELAPHTSAVVAEMIREVFDPHYIAILEGGVEVSEALLQEKFDYIFFTGGTGVGRIVYQAAAKHLTPVTLELGGKSPCIIDKDTDISTTAKRIAWGKFINAGQTCIAPDYLLVHARVKDRLVRAIQDCVRDFYGENTAESPDYCRIINERHYERLVAYLQDGHILMGGQHNKASKFIAPTLLDNVSLDSSVMQEEIFGPILPIIEFSDVEEVIDLVNDRAKPLALYIFSRSQKFIDKILHHTSSGGVAINDTVMHIGNPNLPFGGVGDSGLGAYHSKSSFDLFSHQRSVLHKSFLIDPPVRYAPYKLSLGILKKLMRWSF
jgi:acyl-CoA reductase-like NAD-dependent aldehyde dehydrogenase